MRIAHKVKVKKTIFDQTLDLVNFSTLLIIWITVLVNYTDLPEVIPVHYNASGEVDGYGAKPMIFLLPAIASIIFIGLMLLNRIPHIYNYPVKITEENAPRLYRNATRMIRFLIMFILLTFGFLTLKDILHTKDQSESLGAWFLPVILLLFSAPVAYFLYSIFKKKAR